MSKPQPPRRPQGQSGPAQCSNAREKVGGFVDPTSSELLSSFLGAAHIAEDRESGISVALKLMSKVSETTKTKALTDLTGRVRDVSEGVLVPYVGAILDQVHMHVDHESCQLRAGLFQLLCEVVQKGKAVKQQIAPTLTSFMGPWLFGMCDMESAVRAEANRSFQLCFAEDKRTAAIQRFAFEAASYAIDRLMEVVGKENAKIQPLLDDATDPKANIVFASLGVCSQLMRQAPTAHKAVLDFVSGSTFSKHYAPQRSTTKGSLLFRTPRARSAVLALLRDIAELCPMDSKRHQLIATSVAASLMEADALVALRLWELLVSWVKKHGSAAIDSFPPKFLDAVVDAVMQCEVPETLDVQLKFLLAFVAVVSKDARCAGAVDEYCGALVEKVGRLREGVNVPVTVMHAAWSSMLEFWELLCLRTIREGGTPQGGEDAFSSMHSSGLELFAVMVHNFVLIQANPKKAQRYASAIASSVAASVKRACGRDSFLLVPLLHILCLDETKQPFSAIPLDESDPDALQGYTLEHLRRSLLSVCAQVVGELSSLYSTSPVLQEGVASSTAVSGGEYVLQVVRGVAGKAVQDKQWSALLTLMRAAHGGFQLDGKTSADLAIEIKRRLSEGASEEASSDKSLTEPLLKLLLSHGDEATVSTMSPLLQSASHSWVRNTFHDAMLSRDPTTLLPSLLAAIGTAVTVVDDVERLAHHVQEHVLPTGHWSEGDRACLRSSVEHAVASLSANHNSNSAPRSGEGESSTTPGSSDEDGEGNSSSSDSESSKDSATRDNQGLANGQYVMANVLSWCTLLCSSKRRSSLVTLLGYSDADFTASSLPCDLVGACISVAPRLQCGTFASAALMRMVAAAEADNEEDDSEDGVVEASVWDSLDAKRAWVGASEYRVCVESVSDVLDEFHVDPELRLQWSSACLQKGLECNGAAGATNQWASVFAFRIPDSLVQRYLSASHLWTQWRIASVFSSNTITHVVPQFDGGFSLCHQDEHFDVTNVVRFGQLVKAADTFQLAEHTDVTTSAAFAVACLEAAANSECFSESVHHTLVYRVLRSLLLRLWNSGDGYDTLCKSIAEAGSFYTLATLGRVIVNLTMRDDNEQSVWAAVMRQCLSSVVSTLLIPRLLPSTVSSLSLSAESESIFKIAFTLFEHAYQCASIAREDVLFVAMASSSWSTQLISKYLSSESKPADGTPASVVMALLILRHESSKQPLLDEAVRCVAKFASSRRNPVEHLFVITELLCARVINRSLYLDVVAQATSALVSAYPLHFLPSNGRLGQRPPASAPLPLGVLLDVVRCAKSILRALHYHGTIDDVLRSSTYLVMFDVICVTVSELTRRLNKQDRATTSDLTLLVSIIVHVSQEIQSLTPQDVAPLRASDKSTTVICNAFVFVHQWLSGTTVARIESMGVERVQRVVASICLLLHLTMIRSTNEIPQAMYDHVVRKSGVKPLRKELHEFSTVEPQRLQRFRKYQSLLRHAQKQKMLIEMTLLTWAIIASNQNEGGRPFSQECLGEPKEQKKLVYDMLDAVLALSLSPAFTHATAQAPSVSALVSGHHGSSVKGRLEDTLLFVCGEEESAECVDSVGYDVAALTRPLGLHADTSMTQLARGALSVLTLLLQTLLLGQVKDWMETIDKRLREPLQQLLEAQISPALITNALGDVLSHSSDGTPTFEVDENLSVTVNMGLRSVEVRFQLDEIEVKFSIVLPKAFPIRPAVVSSQDAVTSSGGSSSSSSADRVQGIRNEKWRSWIMKMTVMLFNNSTDLWGCVQLFEQNIKKHFSGVEPCPICYAVVSAANNRLPDMRCAVCRNSMFHSSCLFTWWGNSGQTSCPMCRSPWVSQN